MQQSSEFAHGVRRPGIRDAEYRYPPSKNPYAAKLETLGKRVYWDNETETFQGRWREQMLDHSSLVAASAQDPLPRRKLQVEIGCNGGHVSLEWAAQNPHTAYIGIDWKFKQIFRGAEKSANRSINNLLFLRANAERIKYQFAPGEIDRLCLYFPDPWPKKGQQKNRFIQEFRLREVHPLLTPKTGRFHIKTDHAGYFEWMVQEIEKTQDLFKVISLTRDLHASHPNAKSLQIPEVTLFEKLFIKDGLPIHSVELEPI
jgi:tRNA (guanine-N7-)-methyltransferase